MRRGGLTGPHRNGWGITFYEDKGCRTFKAPSPCYDPKFVSLTTKDTKIINKLSFCSDIKLPFGLKTLEDYLQIFQNAGDQHLAVGEASVAYLPSHVAVKNILEFNPAAKFIVMVRNPVDMAQSLHGQMLRVSNLKVIDDFEEDWQARSAGKFELGKFNHPSWDPKLYQYDKACKLGEQVQRLLQTVAAKSVLFIVMDD